MRLPLAAAALLLALCGPGRAGTGDPAAMPDAAISDAARHDLAPTGRLRAAINLGNPVLAGRDARGELTGVSVALARALAGRLGVPLDLVPFDSAGAVSGSARADRWDVCFLAVDPKRAEDIAFTAPYVVIEGSYMVPVASPITTMEAVDRAGVRIAVGRGSAYDLYLSRAIRHATIERAPTSAEAVTLFAAKELEVAANVRQPLEAYAATHPEVRLLPGRFMEIAQAMGIVAGRPAGAAYLGAFLDEAKRGDLIAAALRASGQDPALAAGR